MAWFKRHECRVLTEIKVQRVQDPDTWNAGFDACLKILEAHGKKAAFRADMKTPPPPDFGWNFVFSSSAQIRERNRRYAATLAEAHLAKAKADAEFKARVLKVVDNR